MSSPLVERLAQELGYPLLDTNGLDDFLDSQECSVPFFTEDPKRRHPESNDIAVVLPELVKAFDGRFTPAVIDRGAEKKFQALYGFKVWPALVFLRATSTWAPSPESRTGATICRWSMNCSAPSPPARSQSPGLGACARGTP